MMASDALGGIAVSGPPAGRMRMSYPRDRLVGSAFRISRKSVMSNLNPGPSQSSRMGRLCGMSSKINELLVMTRRRADGPRLTRTQDATPAMAHPIAMKRAGPREYGGIDFGSGATRK